MAKININPDINIISHGKFVTEITAIYNNQFVRKVYVGLPYKKALEQFEKDMEKGK